MPSHPSLQLMMVGAANPFFIPLNTRPAVITYSAPSMAAWLFQVKPRAEEVVWKPEPRCLWPLLRVDPQVKAYLTPTSVQDPI